jgi:hypothetical protein
MREYINIIENAELPLTEGLNAGSAGALVGGLLFGIPGIMGLYYMGGAGVAAGAGAAAVLGTALVGFYHHIGVKYGNQKIFSVFVNGKKIHDGLDSEDAIKVIKDMSKKEHDPNTSYTIFDNKQDKIVWRFKVGDEEGTAVDETV